MQTTTSLHPNVASRWQSRVHAFRGFLRMARMERTLSLWIASMVLAPLAGTTAYANTPSTFVSRYNALTQRQTELLYTDGTLSQLRVEITYDQLQLLYNDTRFIYWTHELNSVLQRLQQVDAMSLSSALENLRMIATYPETDPCTIFGNRLECLVHTAQQMANTLAQRSQEMFGNLNTQARFNDWAHRWEEAIHHAEQHAREQCQQDRFFTLYSLYCSDLLFEQGYEEAFESLKAEFPAFAQYLEVSQEAATKAATVFADPTVVQTVAQYTQEFATSVQELLGVGGEVITDYEVVVEQFQGRLTELLAADQTYQDLQSKSQQVAAALHNLRQMIHDTVAYCLQFGYGEQCFAPHFNTGLQAVLPHYHPTHDQVLMDAAELAESANQFWYWFSQSDALHTLQQDYVNTVQDTVAAVLPDLQQAQETFKHHVLAIPEVAAQVGDLWNQMAELARELGATN